MTNGLGGGCYKSTIVATLIFAAAGSFVVSPGLRNAVLEKAALMPNPVLEASVAPQVMSDLASCGYELSPAGSLGEYALAAKPNSHMIVSRRTGALWNLYPIDPSISAYGASVEDGAEPNLGLVDALDNIRDALNLPLAARQTTYGAALEGCVQNG
ncbi:hypothetical protein HYY74_06635 [Candidatus Woesearchaeota archaeon]|nr:hypothetical protein [Candidatus Woesearchaeota archaeon]